MGLFSRRTSVFKGKHVLVTGGTGTCATMVMWGGFSKSQHAEGIGLETAMDLLRRGAFVSVCSRSSTKVDAAVATLRELTTSLDGQGARTRVFGKAADVTVAAEVAAVVASAEQQFGPIDTLISNAGMATPGFFLDQDMSVFQKTMDVNYFGTLTVIKAVLPGMLQRRHGRVVVTSSAAVFCSFAGYGSYAPTKWALRGLCDVLRSELLGTGISMHYATPLDTETPGYIEENKTKPQLVHDLTKAVGADLYSPKVVAVTALDALERGRYHLTTPDLGTNLIADLLAGFTPSRLPTLLVCLISPIIVLVAWVLGRQADAVARKHNAQTAQEQPKAGKKGT